jgi:hypothetical protein
MNTARNKGALSDEPMNQEPNSPSEEYYSPDEGRNLRRTNRGYGLPASDSNNKDIAPNLASNQDHHPTTMMLSTTQNETTLSQRDQAIITSIINMILQANQALVTPDLSPNAPKYSGEPGEDLICWIGTINFLLRTNTSWNDEQKAGAAFKQLTGRTRRWFILNQERAEQHSELAIKTWQDMCDRIKKHFLSASHQHAVNRELRTIIQEQFKSIDQYIARFQDLTAILSKIDENFLVYNFAYGLSSQAAASAILSTPDCTLEKAYEIAAAQDHTMSILSQKGNHRRQADDDGVAPMELDAMEQRRGAIVRYKCKK